MEVFLRRVRGLVRLMDGTFRFLGSFNARPTALVVLPPRSWEKRDVGVASMVLGDLPLLV
jgi:hypothetical protein